MTPEQEGLLLKAERSIRAARQLLEAGDTDFSASRSYYAMFYLAEALLLQDGLQFASHGATLAALGRNFAATGRVPRRVHQYLHRGYETRQVGDYHIANEIAAEVAQTQISRAEEFLVIARNVLADSERQSNQA